MQPEREGRLCSVLPEEGDTNGGDQQGDTGCVAQRGVGDLLDHNAQQRAGDDGGAHSSDRAKAQFVPSRTQDMYAPTMMTSPWAKFSSEDNAVHHAVAQCDQCIDAAKGQAVDQLAKEHCHGWILPFFAAFIHRWIHFFRCDGASETFPRPGKAGAQRRMRALAANGLPVNCYKKGERLTRKKLFRRSPKNHGVCSVRAAPSPVDGTARIRTFPSARACRPRRSGWQCS